MLLITYEHYEHFYYKFINSTYLINSELWTVPYIDMTMTWTITPLASLNCSAAAAAATASGRETWSANAEMFQLLRRVVVVVYRYYIGITLLVFWVNFPNHNDNKDRWGTGHIKEDIKMTRSLETEPLDRSYTTYYYSSDLTLNIIVILKWGLEVTQGHWKWYLWKLGYGFLFAFHK